METSRVDLPPVGLEAIAEVRDGAGRAELHADVGAAADDREAGPLGAVRRVLELFRRCESVVGARLSADHEGRGEHERRGES